MMETEKDVLRKTFFEQKLQEVEKLSPENKEIATLLLKAEFDYDYYRTSSRESRTAKDLLWEGKQSIEEVFTGNQYEILTCLFGTYADKVKAIWDLSPNYPYQQGYYRRSFRSKQNTYLYMENNLQKISGFLELVAEQFSLKDNLSDTNYSWNRSLPSLIAYEMDNNHLELFNQIKDIIYGDNNVGTVTRPIILGLLMSHSEPAHKMVGDLLLAAKLQEGLRQTITECLDEGSIQGFLYILKIILDNNLERFSSIIRAFDTWTGLGLEAQKPATVKKCLQAIYDCLANENYLTSCLHSPDVMLFYIGLWTKAVGDVTDCSNTIQKLLLEEKYKKLVCLYFISNFQSVELQKTHAKSLIDPTDFEISAWVVRNLYEGISTWSIETDGKTATEIDGEIFQRLKQLLDTMPKKEIFFEESVFPWSNITLSMDNILIKMIYIASLFRSDEMFDLLLDYRKQMGSNTRHYLLKHMEKPRNEKQKNALLDALSDRSSSTRMWALETFGKLPSISTEDFSTIENLLKYKVGREQAIELLLKQSSNSLYETVERLLSDKKEEKRLGGLDIVMNIKTNEDFQSIYPACLELVTQMETSSTKEQVLIHTITTKTNQDSLENGFHLYDPNQKLSLPTFTKKEKKASIFKIFKPKKYVLESILSTSEDILKNILQKLSDLFEEHKEYEYTVTYYNGERSTVLLGTSFYRLEYSLQKDTLDNYPLSEVWRNFAKEQQITTEQLLELEFYGRMHSHYGGSSTKKEWFSNLLSKLYDENKKENINKFRDKLPYDNSISQVLSLLLQECPKEEVFHLTYESAMNVYLAIPEDKFTESCFETETYYYNKKICTDTVSISYWYSQMKNAVYNDETFTDAFHTLYYYYQKTEYKNERFFGELYFARALELNLIDENEMFKEFFERPSGSGHINYFTDKRNKMKLNDYPKIVDIGNKVIAKVLDIESSRGDTSTEVTNLATQINHFEGIEYFAKLIINFSEKDTLMRGYFYGYSNNYTKKEIQSKLLKCVFPKPDENAEMLKELLKGKNLSNKTLLDVAMYAPQWIAMLEDYLGWEGLASACWYFHAHLNESFSDEKEAIIAKYSPISSVDFNDGSFDIDWFHESYNTLGEERFQMVYDSAKYISEGSNHRRSQLFCDAVLGKLAVADVEMSIDKRNKNYVLCYGLLPMNDKKKETMHRYAKLQQFLKESKKFGAQRRESEGKVVSIALQNLARNAEFANVTRMIWNVETESIKEMEQYFKPTQVNDWELHIEMDTTGMAHLIITKEGKKLKTIPTKLKSNEYFKTLKAAQTTLKEQYRRSKATLEKTMESEEMFTVTELNNMENHPILVPLMKNLLFMSGEKIGYFHAGTLHDVDETITTLSADDNILIAHPIHLLKSGKWADYQKDIFTKQIAQPFKQVFREVYTPTEDELHEGTLSRRYAGHQVQPQKTVALLKNRLWVASHEEGLQKVYHKENIIVTMYALADWFSPAEIEAPTLETVRFFNRKTYEPIQIKDIPAVIFSEVMRDIDLVVSVAHVGGVDPEASHSTVEMRTAMVRELLPILKLANVKIKGTHAHIQGLFGHYTVHLGSGMVNKMASGSVYIIPVHSQHRGRIFLPFVDEDPKTAEILSKIIMLANDKTLKDPTILSQLKA